MTPAKSRVAGGGGIRNRLHTLDSDMRIYHHTVTQVGILNLIHRDFQQIAGVNDHFGGAPFRALANFHNLPVKRDRLRSVIVRFHALDLSDESVNRLLRVFATKQLLVFMNTYSKKHAKGEHME
jgi:hypothetical protein